MSDELLDAETRAAPVRVGVTLTGDQYRQLRGIALARWRARYAKRLLPDDSVSLLIGELLEHALEQLAISAEERRVVEANRRHIAAVTAPWPTGPWSQDEVDEVVRLANAGQSVETIAAGVYRRKADVASLLRGFGLQASRSTRRTA